MRIDGIDPSQTTGEVAAFFAEQEKQFGMTLPPSRLLARRPSILLGLHALAEGVRKSGLLPVALIALINRRVASHNDCPF